MISLGIVAMNCRKRKQPNAPVRPGTPLVVTNSEELRTVQIGLSSFQTQYGTADWGAMMAAATLVSAPVLIVFFFAQKYFIEGITMTGIKG
ncbi:ABC transporter permease family protein [Paenibacillus glycinis]|uniref:hypothetical protein n=1 Tax=Paenibacillus glycinis TaxID=2697035 RepID=UPI001F41CC6F|nr:hypothetical protein [Paenibacillus glycinis]